MEHKNAHIPIDHLRIYVEDCLNISDYIISVGCGNGQYEYSISENNLNLKNKLILVDPNPESFRKYPADSKYLKTNYKSVSDLIKDKPNVINNCVLLLIWPYSNDQLILNPKEDVNYDIESVKNLNPNSIICLYDTPQTMPNGSSGSNELICFIRGSCDQSSTANDMSQAYRHINTTKYAFKDDLGNSYPKISWLAKKGSQVPKIKKC